MICYVKMNFLAELEPLTQLMLHNIADEATSSASVLNSQNQLSLGQQGLENQRVLNLQNIAAQREFNTSGQNFTAVQNQLNRQATTSNIELQNQSAANLQNARFNSLNQLQTQRLQTFQSMQTTNNIAKFAGSALNFGGGLISAGLQFAANNQAASLQRQNFDYMTTKASDAYSQAGLPSWLAFQNTGSSQMMMNSLPRTAQVFSGSNMMQSSLPGNPMSQAWTGSESQSALGMGNVPLAQ